jgi:hypothetical protein
MSMQTAEYLRLIQFLDDAGRLEIGRVDEDGRRVGAEDAPHLRAGSARPAASEPACGAGAVIAGRGEEDYAALLESGRMLPPLTHPEPHRCLVSGTGLTHLGSAATRDAMHQKAAASAEPATDSARMFRWGIEGGKPAGELPGVQPEWFYKGNGSIVVGWVAITAPAFALDCGEPELVGLYVISPQARHCGWATPSATFSDHVWYNYLCRRIPSCRCA